MASKHLELNEEHHQILKEENEIHNQKFVDFHKQGFQLMMQEAIFLANDILKQNGERPGVGDFDEKLTELTKKIVNEKIDLLGSYLEILVLVIEKIHFVLIPFWFI